MMKNNYTSKKWLSTKIIKIQFYLTPYIKVQIVQKFKYKKNKKTNFKCWKNVGEYFGNIEIGKLWKFPLWHRGLMIQIVSGVGLIPSVAQVLRIRHFRSYGLDHTCSSNSIPGRGISLWHKGDWKRRRREEIEKFFLSKT